MGSNPGRLPDFLSAEDLSSDDDGQASESDSATPKLSRTESPKLHGVTGGCPLRQPARAISKELSDEEIDDGWPSDEETAIDEVEEQTIQASGTHLSAVYGDDFPVEKNESQHERVQSAAKRSRTTSNIKFRPHHVAVREHIGVRKPLKSIMERVAEQKEKILKRQRFDLWKQEKKRRERESKQERKEREFRQRLIRNGPLRSTRDAESRWSPY